MTKEVNLTEALKHYFGFDKFKGDQEAIIRNLLDGNDSFVLMPTGGVVTEPARNKSGHVLLPRWMMKKSVGGPISRW